MLVLDTNVVAEMMGPAPDDRVRAWLDGQATSRLFVTTITKAEIRHGIARLPEGQRKASLASAADRVFHELFRGRVLAFDTEAADAYAVIAADREAAGHPITTLDCQIAAIARVHGADVATRNVRDFRGCGFTVMNPWDSTE